MDKQKQKLDYLLRANLILSSTLDPKELLTQIIDLAKDVVDAQAASILLYDKIDGVLAFDVALGGKEASLKTVKLKIGEGIAGACAKDRKTIIINDVSKDSRWSSSADEKTSFKTKSLIAVPMLFKNELVGVLEVLNRTTAVLLPRIPPYSRLLRRNPR
jgi:GAF domain-containing protein